MTQVNKENTNKEILEAAGALFKSTGYSGVSLESVAQEASIDTQTLTDQYSTKETLCVAWLSDIHQRSEEHHKAILASQEPPLKKLEDYFNHLKGWMLEYSFEGCPFTNMNQSLGAESAENVREEIKLHKHYVCDFFVTLSAAFTATPKEAEWLGRQLFLLYSAATTEAKNLQEIWPIEQAAQLAIESCQVALERTQISTI